MYAGEGEFAAKQPEDEAPKPGTREEQQALFEIIEALQPMDAAQRTRLLCQARDFFQLYLGD